MIHIPVLVMPLTVKALAAPVRLMPLKEALSTHFDYDAFLTTYYVAGETEQYRLTKPSLRKIRHGGGVVEHHAVVVEIDTKDIFGEKKPWKPEQRHVFLAMLGDVAPYPPPSFIYWTKNGARLIYALSSPISPEVYEAAVRRLIKEYTLSGLKLDVSCTDWTRLFRLPNVVRDEERLMSPILGEGTIYNIEDLDVGDCAKIDDDAPLVEREHVEIGDCPDAGEAKALLLNLQTGGPSDWFKRAKRKSKSLPYYHAVFEGGRLAREHEKDDTIHSYVGCACKHLYYVAETTPEHIYAMFHGPVGTLGISKDHRDGQTWHTVLWRACQVWWAAEKESEGARSIQQDISAESVEVTVAAMRQWCDSPQLRGEIGDAVTFVRRHAIAIHMSCYYVLRPDGVFSPHPARRDSLIALIQQVQATAIVNVQKVGQGGLTWRTVEEILNDHAFKVRSCEARVTLPGNVTSGAVVEGLGGSDDIGATLCLSMYRLNPAITPQRDEEVDLWLRAFCGRNYAQVCSWIGHALHLTGRPLCALSLEAPPGIGKGMFVQGLIECLERPTFVAPAAIAATFNHTIDESPFCHINENWGDFRPDLPDRFREFVAGDPVHVTEKYMAPRVIRNPIRFIMTANNAQPIEMLFGARPLTRRDRDGLEVRLLHFRLGEEARNLLNEKGNRQWTGGWVRDEQNGGKSTYRVAKHFLWLHAQRPHQEPKSRFLMDGFLDPTVARAVTMRSDLVEKVVEILCRMVSGRSAAAGLVVRQTTGDMFVSAHLILDHIRTRFKSNANAGEIQEVLESICAGDDTGITEVIKDDKGVDQVEARWYKIDVGLLHSETLNLGLDPGVVKKLVEKSAGARKSEKPLVIEFDPVL